MAGDRWKSSERDAGLQLGGTRIPNNGFGQPDVDHPVYAIQVKTFKAFPVWFATKWEQTKRDAVKIGKVPLLALYHKAGQGHKTESLVVVPMAHYSDLLTELEALRARTAPIADPVAAMIALPDDAYTGPTFTAGTPLSPELVLRLRQSMADVLAGKVAA